MSAVNQAAAGNLPPPHPPQTFLTSPSRADRSACAVEVCSQCSRGLHVSEGQSILLLFSCFKASQTQSEREREELEEQKNE